MQYVRTTFAGAEWVSADIAWLGKKEWHVCYTTRDEAGVFKVREFVLVCCARPPKLRQSARRKCQKFTNLTTQNSYLYRTYEQGHATIHWEVGWLFSPKMSKIANWRNAFSEHYLLLMFCPHNLVAVRQAKAQHKQKVIHTKPSLSNGRLGDEIRLLLVANAVKMGNAVIALLPVRPAQPCQDRLLQGKSGFSSFALKKGAMRGECMHKRAG